MRHPAIEAGIEPYRETIPELRSNNQSVNRERFCVSPLDVLFNTNETEAGKHYLHGMEIAALSVGEVKAINCPNQHSIRFAKDDPTKILKEADVFTVCVVHDPTECMYPHCELVVMKNNNILKGSPPNGVKAALRMDLAKIARRYRAKMNKIVIDPVHFSPQP